MNIKKHIPNTITLVNLALGFASILINDPYLSPLLILGASLADLLDGLFARLLNVKSEIGAQLDSFADMLSFGVAPAFLYYHHVMPDNLLALFLICLLPVMAVIRLAIFNLDDDQAYSFKGLPSPSCGLFFTFLVYGGREGFFFLQNELVIYSLPLIFGILMLLPVKMMSFKGFAQKKSSEKILIVLLALSFIPLLIYGGLKSISLMVLAYMLISLINNFIK